MDKIFNDRYEITEKIGTGGMADVYKAVDKVLERTVAIKVLHPQYATESSFISRFKREAKAAANLTHPNIVNIFDWGQQGSNYYIVMEYIEGHDLKHILTEKQKLGWKDAALIGKKVAQALTFAHRNDVVHRDIKPHNIIITDDKDVKVTDFGIARAGASTMTQTGTILGTAHYISPEQAQGSPADARSDIYSLGVVLYEMVSGKTPFDGDNPIGIAMKHVSEALPMLEDVDIPQDFKNVITKSLAKDPEERYQTAEELRGDLNNVLQGKDVEAPLSSEAKTVVISPGKKAAPVKPTPKKKRKKWPYFMLALALLAVAGIFAYSLLWAGNIIVPNVVGMKTQEAAKELKQKKLAMKIVERRFDEEYPAGRVIEQDPEDGAKVTKGTIVEVVVSRGIEKVEVPDVTGQTREEAEQTLLDAGLTLGNVTYRESEPAGIVLSQDPEPDELIGRSEPVNLVISKEIAQVTVPNVIGRSKKNAGVILGQAGLRVSYSDQYNDDVEAGLVIDQTPSAGDQVKKGSTVIVYVSKGPEKNVIVPDVSGSTKADATAQITALGLKVKYSGAGNTVDHQSPAGGTKVSEGSTVTLYLVP